MADLSYRASLKPLDVEEVIDLLVHRPLGYLIARASYPTAISPDQLTMVSMAVGITAGAMLWTTFFTERDLVAPAGLLFILSAVIDCSDGQLARMRQSSSAFGRMLDGAVDSIVQLAVVPAVVALLLRGHVADGRLWPWAIASVVGIGTGLQHTTLYDHFKNVYLHHIQPRRKEGDDLDDVERAWQECLARGPSPLDHLRFGVYRNYLRGQRRLLARVDPFIPVRFVDMAPYSDEGAARYRASHRPLMRAWSFYGIGTHIFALGVAMMFDRVEAYILLRLSMNLGLAALIPLQRRASRAFFQAPARAESP